MRSFRKTLVVKALDPAVRTNGTVNGTTVDRTQSNTNRFGTCYFAICCGALTDGVHTFSIEDSDDASSWGAAAAGDVDGTAKVTDSSTDDNVAASFGYRGPKRYVRLKCVTSGATSGGIVGAVCVLGNPKITPTQ